MRRADWVMRAVAVAAMGVAVWGCAGQCPDGTVAGQPDLTRGASILRKYGMASISSPVLVPCRPDLESPFAFELNKSASDYFDMARADNGFALSSQNLSELVLRLAGKASFNPTLADAFDEKKSAYETGDAMRKAAMQDQVRAAVEHRQRERERILADKGLSAAERNKQLMEADAAYIAAIKDAASTAPTEPPTASGQSLPATDLAAPEAVKNLVGKKEAPTVDGSKLAMPVRGSIIAAGGDVATQGILRVLGNPAAFSNMKGKKVLFGVGMVSVEPGYVTREGFAADVAMRVNYEWRRARPEAIAQALQDEGATAEYLAAALNHKDLPSNAKLGKVPLETLLAAAAASKSGGKGSGFLTFREDSESFANLKAATRPSGEGNDGTNSFLSSARAMAATGIVREVAKTNYQETPLQLLYHPGGKESAMPVSPLVSAVSPMTDVQSLDLASSVQKRREFALDLAFALEMAGLGAQAKAFMSYAQQLDDVSASRTMLATATTYSSSGGVVGFQVGPRFAASLLPKKNGKGNQAGISNVLERQSFPVLFVIVIDQSDLRLRFDKEGNAYEPHISMSQTARWLPLSAAKDRESLPETEWQGAVRGLTPTTMPTTMPRKKRAAQERSGKDLQLMADAGLNLAGGAQQPSASEPRASDVPAELTQLRAEILQHQVGGSSCSQEVPLELMPGWISRPARIASVRPAVVPVTVDETQVPPVQDVREVAVYVEGEGLEGYTEAEVVPGDGVPLAPSPVRGVVVLGDGGLRVTLGVPSTTSVWSLKLSKRGDPDSARLTPPIWIKVTKKGPAAGLAELLELKTTTPTGETLQKIRLNPAAGLDGDEIGKLVESLRNKKEELPPALQVEVRRSPGGGGAGGGGATTRPSGR